MIQSRKEAKPAKGEKKKRESIEVTIVERTALVVV